MPDSEIKTTMRMESGAASSTAAAAVASTAFAPAIAAGSAIAPSSSSGNSNDIVSALVSFLRHEADLAEQNARRLRDQATRLAQEYGVSNDMQDQYELDPDEMPPLDEHGVPKYRGKKRGRKPKKRKRKMNPQRGKRQHTAYTLFVQTNYPSVRGQHPELPSKNVISIVARQWANVSATEKLAWKQRALETRDDGVTTATMNTTLDGSTTKDVAHHVAAEAATSNDAIGDSTTLVLTADGISAADVLAAGVEAGVVDPDDDFEDGDDDGIDEDDDNGDGEHDVERADEDSADQENDQDDDNTDRRFGEDHGADNDEEDDEVEDDDNDADGFEHSVGARATRPSRSSSNQQRKVTSSRTPRRPKRKTTYD